MVVVSDVVLLLAVNGIIEMVKLIVVLTLFLTREGEREKYMKVCIMRKLNLDVRI